MDCQGVGSPKKPTTSGNDFGADMDLDTETQGSNIATMEPYTSPVSTGKKKIVNVKNYAKNENSNKNGKMQILPGVYELVSYSKYLIIHFEDGKCENVNVFKGNREIVNCCGGQPKIRSQMDGNLSIEVYSLEQSEKLMKMTQLVGRKVSVIPHPIFNQCRGVIYAPELLSIDPEEIQSELEEQNVTRVVRMRKKVQDQFIPLPTLILTFSTYKLPSIIKAGWLNFKVKPYIPSPIRCYHCQMYGHLIQKCKRRLNQEPAICQNCGKNAHGECNETPSCIHCGEGHASSSKNCSRFIYEKEVQAIKVLEKVTFKEARRKALDKQIRPGESFSSIMKNKMPQKQPQPTVPNSSEVVTGNLNVHNDTSITEKQVGQKVSSPVPVQSSSKEQNRIKAKDQPKLHATNPTLTPSEKKDSSQETGTSNKINTPKPDKSKRKRVTTPDKETDENNDKDDAKSFKKAGSTPRNAFKLKRVENTK